MMGNQEVRDRVGCMESPRTDREIGKMMRMWKEDNDSSGRRRRLI